MKTRSEMAKSAFCANSGNLAVAIKAVIRKTINLNLRTILNNAGIRNVSKRQRRGK